MTFVVRVGVYWGETTPTTRCPGNAHPEGRTIQVVMALWPESCMQKWSSKTISHDKCSLISRGEDGGRELATHLQVHRIYQDSLMQITRPAMDKNYEVIDVTHRLLQVWKQNRDTTPRIEEGW